MKKKFFYTVSLFTLIMLLTLNLSAEMLPEFDLPHTFPDDGQEGEFDLNGDGQTDIRVSYSLYSYDSDDIPEDSYRVELRPLNSGSIIAEDAPLTQIEQIAKFSSLLTEGTSIGNTAPTGASWYGGTVMVAHQSFAQGFVAPTGTYLDDINEGFLGLKIKDISGDYFYSWLYVDIDDDNKKVTFSAAAVAEAPSTAILAGASGEIVPISIIASLFGFFAIGTGLFYRRKRKLA